MPKEPIPVPKRMFFGFLNTLTPFSIAISLVVLPSFTLLKYVGIKNIATKDNGIDNAYNVLK